MGAKLKWYKLLPVKQKIVGSSPIAPAFMVLLKCWSHFSEMKISNVVNSK